MFLIDIFNKKRSPFRDDKIYLIFYNPPHVYIDIADKLLNKFLLTEFKFYTFVDEWIVEYNNREYKVRAILLYYGLPLRKHKILGTKIPNLEDLENSSNKYMYYVAGMYWILINLYNIKPNKIKKLLNLTRKVNGRPIKAKELEGKNLIIYPNISDLLDFYDLISRAKTIDLLNYYDWILKQP